VAAVDLTAKQFLQGELERKLAGAREVTREAESAGRPMTDDERKSVEDTLTEAANLKAQIKGMSDAEALNEAIDRLGTVSMKGAVEGQTPKSYKTIGEAFVNHPQYKALREHGLAGSWTTGPIEIGGQKVALEIDGETVLSERVESVGTPATDFLGLDVQPGIQAPGYAPLVVADLFAPGTTNSSLVRYLREVPPGDNNASGVAEGAAKPASSFTFEAVDEPVKKIATFLPVTDEMMEDVAQLQSYLNSRLSLFVRMEENDQLLNGGGTNDLVGILNRTNVGNVDSGDYDNLFDAILAAMNTVRQEGFLEPDAVVLNPTDDFTLRTAKSATNGMYFGGGPYAPGANNPWGLRAVNTVAITAGTLLVGAFRSAAQIFRRSGLSVEASNSHKDWFQKNITAIRAEERLALAVYREEAFCTVTVTS
jgi:HK97 family phage major capsid protein